jgi:uncharacterized membrane protein YhhN
MNIVQKCLFVLITFVLIPLDFYTRAVERVFNPLYTAGSVIPLVAVFVLAGRQRFSFYSIFIFLGVVSSAIAGPFMVTEGGFLWGLRFFLLAHLCFIAAFTSRTSWRLRDLPWFVPFFGYALFVFLTTYTKMGENLPWVFAYMCAIATMGWRAMACFVRDRSWATFWGMLGATSFVLSDSLICLAKFGTLSPYPDHIVMLTYNLGEALIAYSILKAAAPTPDSTKAAA